MTRLNRPVLCFIGLLVALNTASNIGCSIETHGTANDTSSSTTSGAGGGGGEGGAMGCTPGAKQACYSGPVETTNIGTCKPGTQTCLADGTGFDACVGEVLPVLENCVAMGDEDCNGVADIKDGECKCTTPGLTEPCSTGLLGACSVGMGVCAQDGRSFESCTQTTMPTPETCETAQDDDCDGSIAVLCTGDVKWTHAAGGAATKDDAIFSVAYTADGGSIIAGVVDGTIGGDGFGIMMAGTAYIAKLDANKAIVWERYYSSSMFAVARGVAVDKDGNIILVGSFNGNMIIESATLVAEGTDMFLMKLSPTGTVIWAKPLSATKTQNAFGVAVDGNGYIYMTGSTDNAVDFGGGMLSATGTDAFIACYAPDGMHHWSKIFDSPGNQFGRAIAVTSNNDVVFIGDSDNADVDLGGGNIPKGGNLDIFVARYGNDGTHRWSKLFGKAMDQVGRGVAMAPDGSVLFTGGFEGTIEWKPDTIMTKVGTSDVYVGKLDGTTGDYIAHVQGGQTGTSVGTAIGVDAEGNVTIAGHVSGSIDFGGQLAISAAGTFDAFLVKLNGKNGSPIWTKTFGKMGNQFAWDVAIAGDGSALIGGGFYTELDVPPAPMSIKSTGGSDLYAVSTTP